MLIHSTINSEIFARVYFRESSHMQSFVKIKSLRNAEITLSFTDICKLCPRCEFLASQMCLLTLIAKKKTSENFRIYSTLFPVEGIGKFFLCCFLFQFYCIIFYIKYFPAKTT